MSAQPAVVAAAVDECVECEEPITGEPVRWDEEVFWMGTANARTWCTADCMHATAERQADQS